MTIDTTTIPPRPGKLESNLTPNDILRQFGSAATSERPVDDAGTLAREKVQVRHSQVKSTLLKTYLFFCTLVVIALIGLGWYLYAAFTAPGTLVTDTRPCEFIDEARSINLTGRRHYSYMEKELFGIQYRDSSKVRTETELDVKGTAMNVVGLSNGGWWGLHIGTGEKGIQLLKPASVLVFTIGTKNVVVNDSVFCK